MSKKALAITVVVILVIVGLGFWVNQKTWVFSSAHSSRGVVDTFLTDIAKGNDQAAYNLTSSSYQKDNSFASFTSSYDALNGNDLKIHYKTYGVSKSYVSVLGTTSNPDTKVSSSFGINIARQSGNKVDSVFIITSN